MLCSEYDHETVLGKLEHYKDTTRKNILNAAVVVLKNDESEKGQEAFKVYEKERDMYNEKYQNMMKARNDSRSQDRRRYDWRTF